jgi:hypothetical protein
MNPSRRTATVLGALYIIIMVSWSLGFGLVSDVLGSPTWLADTFARRDQVAVGGLFELLDAGAVLAMIAVVVPLLGQFNEALAVWYLVFRVIESMLLVLALLCALAVVTLSEASLEAGADTQALEAMGVLCAELRGRWIQLLLVFFYSAAKVPFFSFLWQTRLVPRALAAVGLVSSALVMVSLPLDFLEHEVGMLFGAVMGLTELSLGLWLMIRGFSRRTP